MWISSDIYITDITNITAAYMLSCHTENDAQKYDNYCGPSISCMKFIKEMNKSTIREASHSNKDK